jgi:hypothetical protein
MRGFGMGEDILNKWSIENKQLIEKNQSYDVADIETQIKENAPAPKQRKAAQSPIGKAANTNTKKGIETRKKQQEAKPAPAPGHKSKPFGSVKKPNEDKPNFNISQEKIEQDTPEHKRTAPNENPPTQQKPITQSTKPFQMGGSKAKPVFGKPAMPSGNPTNLNNASVNESNKSAVQENAKEDVKEQPKQEPLSFTEKYGLAKKPDQNPIQPIGRNAGHSNVTRNISGMNDKPSIGGVPANNVSGDYIPTMGGGMSTKPRRVGRPSQESSSVIPTIGNGAYNPSQIDKIPMMGDNNSQIGTLPRRTGQPEPNSQIGRIPTGGYKNDQVDSIPTLNNQNDSNQIGRNQMMMGSNNDQVDSIPTLNNQNAGSRRILTNVQKDPFDNIPTFNSRQANNDSIDNIPTIGDQGISDRRRLNEPSNDSQGYMPTPAQPEPELAGGRKRVSDPFANVTREHTKPTSFNNNNFSRISNNSISNNQDSMFGSNRNDIPKKEDKVQTKKTDFWADMLDGDKSKPAAAPRKIDPPMPSKPMPSNKPTFQDVASLDDEFILD